MKHLTAFCGLNVALSSIWFAALLFHLVPINNDMDWWQFPWAITVIVMAGVIFAYGFNTFFKAMDKRGHQ